jgi:phospholipase/carboxylesterase
MNPAKPHPDPHRDQPVLHRGAALSAARGAVVLLHGRGASAEDILRLADEFTAPDLAYLAPQAAGHTWYPNSFLVPTARNQPWLASALAKVKSVVDVAIAGGIPTEHIVLCGFSQGACLSTEFIARHPTRYGGLIAFTGGLIGDDQEVALPIPGSLAGTPVFFGSGDPDPHVPWARVQQSAAILSAMGAVVSAERYPGRPHTITRDEIDRANRVLSLLR